VNIEIFALLKWGWAGLAAWFWYDKQKGDKVLESVVAKLAQTPTFDEMEKEIARSVSSIKDDQREMIVMTREMSITLNQLVRDLAVLNAKWSMKNDSDKS
jgi:isochorismate synthase EntC